MHCYYLETFGCQMNENDSRTMAGLLESSGYQEAETKEQADIIVVNTCCVRQSAENRINGFIGSLKKIKTMNPGAIIAVCGCMVQKEGSVQRFLRTARHIDILIGTFAISKLPLYIAEKLAGVKETIIDVAEGEKSYLPLTESYPVKRSSDSRAQVSIIYGCDNFCSYCIVPYVRGREKSRDPQIILSEISSLVNDGCREIQLLGQNVNSYGRDLADNWSFARLLQEMSSIPNLARIRYMTSHPKDFSRELVDTIAGLPKVCRHFHLPLQAGCDKTLSAMNRGYNCDYYLQLINYIRRVFPDCAITSDLIVGFPGETDEDFAATLDFVSACKFDAAYTFIYSQRSGTPAAEIPDQINEEIKKERIQRLIAMQEPISLAINCKLIGRHLPVLVEGKSKNNPDMYSGRTESNKIVNFPGDSDMTGQFIDIEIVSAKTWNLLGSAVSPSKGRG
ncbi:MAG: tRNA (N6-isopentenyl adenosine(37)-C2)-methylthiotransferase MiaB [Clostridiales bacterium]|jgi:tRNA-2-methylthio-N6-dimethylallyladenosine synthase|nr:tRNA (N6-isopentenyl adenosine(37)-C2)-methylthiotransferase MiaB [Clostridiales bacterium]MDR2713640.1 tRNA (N6-isopentenyl adenosine(37)-C2)-methylthiotransferase MiaB [Clostridiales bacterium]